MARVERKKNAKHTKTDRSRKGGNNHNNNGAPAMNRAQLSAEVIQLMNSNLTRAYSPKQVIRKLGITERSLKAAVPPVMEQLRDEGLLRQILNGKYQTTKEPDYFTGKVDYVNPRFGFIVSEESEQDIRVRSDDMMNALDGDTVKVLTYGAGFRDKSPEGEVVEIVKRRRNSFVGRIEFATRYAFVVPDHRKMYQDIFVRHADTLDANHNDKVIVEITEWPTDNKNAVGKVIEVLGAAGENEAEMHSIMAEFDLPYEFPQKIVDAAQKIKPGLTKKEFAKRRDFRPVTTFTIDPFNAKDFDDALSIQKLSNGNWEIGIHIADVTHYVKTGSELDKEALERATSVYLVDRVVPMLPERLSNELCSLRPNEEKLTFSSVFEIDEDANVVNEWFGRTVIYSDRRFTYEEAQEGIDTGQGDFAGELKTLNNLALKLRKQRYREGAISFETNEVVFKLDDDGFPVDVIPKVRKDAHKLIEEFMLLANKKVAEFAFNKHDRGEDNTFVYRVHDLPDFGKLVDLSAFAQRFGYSISVDDNKVARSLNKLMASVEGKPEGNLLQTIAIRTMAKAKYTTQAGGHFGLAFDHYAHFTSPIRRYPDVMVHRLLQHYIEDKKPPQKDNFEDMSMHSSERERVAADAERASIKYKQVQYMQTMEDRVFEGLVSGVTDFGVFVEITETNCEGMVRMSNLDDDFYEYDEKNYRIVGKRKGKVIALGDKVKVRVVDTDLDRRTIDLVFAKK